MASLFSFLHNRPLSLSINHKLWPGGSGASWFKQVLRRSQDRRQYGLPAGSFKCYKDRQESSKFRRDAVRLFFIPHVPHSHGSRYDFANPTEPEPCKRVIPPATITLNLPTVLRFITTVRPYIEPLFQRGVSWVIGDAEGSDDAVQEVERFLAREREREGGIMDTLGPYIYHERQEPGSMMCGQHALNSLLQGNYFTAPDLAQIAREVDELEQGVVQGARRGQSANMDDTGYFSVQVLESALKNTFGLTLTRWRSEDMRAFQAHPEAQLGFVLNLDQHWFTLRRFGQRHGKGFWFNLNSFLSAPEWVGSTYLGMVLQQAEEEGYSVFVVRPADPMNPEHGLPETEADILAETLDESAHSGPRPSGFGGGSSLTGAGGNIGAGGRTGTGGGASGSRSSVPGLEDEDVELQRALQASLGGVVYDFPEDSASGSGGGYDAGLGGRHATYGSASRGGFGPSDAYASRTGSRGGLGLGYGGDRPPSRRTPPIAAPDPPTPLIIDDDDDEPSDPVAASAARGRARLEQMQREQRAAMQAMGTSGYGFGAGMDEAVDEQAAQRRREAAERVRRAREEEEEQIRLAMAESLRTHTAGQGDQDQDSPDYFVTPPTTSANLPGGDRHYDDEDAELQAALKASLEEAGNQGLTIPSEPAVAPRTQTNDVPSSSASVPHPAAGPVHSATEVDAGEGEGEGDDEDDEEEEERSPAAATKAEVADADELRRRRLARFGG